VNKPLQQYLRLFRTELASVALFSLGTNLLMLVPTLYMLQLYDRVMSSRNEFTLYAVTLIACFLLVLMAFCEWVRSIVAVRAGVKFDQLLGSRVFTQGFAASAGRQSVRAEETMQNLTQIRHFMTSTGLFAFFDMPWTLLYVAVLFILHPVLGMAAIAFCTIQFGLALWNQRSSDQPLKETGAAASAGNRFIESKARNIETLHAMGMIPHLLERWHRLQAQWNSLDSAAHGIQARNSSVNRFVRYSIQSLMLGLGALLAINGKITIGSMIAANILITRALQPFDAIVGTWRQFIQARQAAARLNQLLQGGEEKSEPDHRQFIMPPAEPPQRGHVVIEHLVVQLPHMTHPVLDGISLELQPGRITTVMGPSGSGKTTLARCLAGLVPWQAETFTLDGLPAEALTAQQWSSQLGYLPQDIELLEGTVADNIARFAEVDAAEVVAAAQLAGIHESILRLPQGYDTLLTESSHLLSGGQQQLLGLARALYKKPALIVLDEPNSRLDEHGDARLLHALAELKSQGKTIVLVSHRSNILKITDQLLILRHGKVSHYGPRELVMAELNHARQMAAEAA